MPSAHEDLRRLERLVGQYPRLFVLSGAGTSTDSGIPGYRDADGRWARQEPLHFQAFRASDAARRRYWRRSMAGWPVLANARPNAAHHALARLEAMGHVPQIVTQNVDGLHQRAGSTRLIELHGNIHRVICLACGNTQSRASMQCVLEAANPEVVASPAAVAGADGDADVEDGDPASFRVPSCALCDGMLKPDVVFFGECVPRERVDAARSALEQADALLVVGSSLMVYSGYRFCEWAARMAKPIAAINLGRTRADALFALKVSARCGTALPALVERLARAAGAGAPAACEVT